MDMLKKVTAKLENGLIGVVGWGAIFAEVVPSGREAGVVGISLDGLSPSVGGFGEGNELVLRGAP